jgi:hypothetical protein
MSRSLEVLFVDPAAADRDTMLGNLSPVVEAIVLDAARPAARQMAAALDGPRGVDALHVIAHGAPERVSVAASDWTAGTVQEAAQERVEDFASIGSAPGEYGELRLWSGDSGSGMPGCAFVEKPAFATGAGVGGATKLAGASALGEPREFAARARRVASQPPLTARGVESYAGLLAGVRRIVSGDVPQDPAETVTYVVVNSRDKQVVTTFSLPGRSHIPKFSIAVNVPRVQTQLGYSQ